MSREYQLEFRCAEILILEEINMFQNKSSHASFPRTFFTWTLNTDILSDEICTKSIDMKNYCFVESLLSSNEGANMFTFVPGIAFLLS